MSRPVAVIAGEDGFVHLDFAQKTSGLVMTPAEARALAIALVQIADKADAAQEPAPAPGRRH